MIKTAAAALAITALLGGAGPALGQVRSPLTGPFHFSVIETGPGNNLFASLLICRSPSPGTRLECVTRLGTSGALALTRVYRHLRGGYIDPAPTADGIWPPHAKSYGTQWCWATYASEDGRSYDGCEAPARDWPEDLAADYKTAMRAIRTAFRREYGR